MECGDEIDEVRSLEPGGAILIPGRETHVGKCSLKLASRQLPGARGARRCCRRRQRPAARDASVRARACAPQPAARSIMTPTSREPRIAPGLLTVTRTHPTPNSSRTSVAMRSARVSTRLNVRAPRRSRSRVWRRLVIDVSATSSGLRRGGSRPRSPGRSTTVCLTRRSQSMKPMMQSTGKTPQKYPISCWIAHSARESSSGHCARASIASAACCPAASALQSGDRDHRRIVGAKLDARIKNTGAARRELPRSCAPAELRSRRRRPRRRAYRSPVSSRARAALWRPASRRSPPALRRPRRPSAQAVISRPRIACSTAVLRPRN